jgi:phosphoglycolate phosphatase
VLLLLDIDGTLLIGASSEHRQALHDGLEEAMGVEIDERVLDQVEYSGRTDIAIGRSMLVAAGHPAGLLDPRLGSFMEAACARYAELVPADLSDTVLPTVPRALDQLADEGHTLALVTGNLGPIAQMKLAAAGIGHHFAPGLGGFGSDHEDRDALPSLARLRAGGGVEPHPREDTLVVGDTPLDIQCARADGVRVVGVTTGSYGMPQLSQADVVLRELGELPDAAWRLARAGV